MQDDGPLCPFGDGRHKKMPWVEKDTRRSGMVCVRCHKTWEWVLDVIPHLIPTWDMMDLSRFSDRGTQAPQPHPDEPGP